MEGRSHMPERQMRHSYTGKSSRTWLSICLGRVRERFSVWITGAQGYHWDRKSLIVDRLSHREVDACAPGRAHHWQSESCAGSSAEGPELELFTGEVPIKRHHGSYMLYNNFFENCEETHMFIEFNLYNSHMTCMLLSHFTTKKSSV